MVEVGRVKRCFPLELIEQIVRNFVRGVALAVIERTEATILFGREQDQGLATMVGDSDRLAKRLVAPTAEMLRQVRSRHAGHVNPFQAFIPDNPQNMQCLGTWQA